MKEYKDLERLGALKKVEVLSLYLNTFYLSVVLGWQRSSALLLRYSVMHKPYSDLQSLARSIYPLLVLNRKMMQPSHKLDQYLVQARLYQRPYYDFLVD